MNATTPLDHARDLIARGLVPIPVPHREKGPTLPGWQRLRTTESDVGRHFSDAPCNIGALLGEPSGWIVDVDIDHPIALDLADSLLPPTAAEWGRDGNPRSHRIYRLTSPAPSRKWSSRSAGMLVELRSTGCQSIAPGSVHPSGELVRWDKSGEPTPIDPEELLAAIESLADAVRSELGESSEPKQSPPRMERSSEYGREALRRESRSVASTAPGSRNDTLNRAAFNLGTLVGSGDLDRLDVEHELLSAARSAGLGDGEARRTIASGVAAGIEHPRARTTDDRDGGRRPRRDDLRDDRPDEDDESDLETMTAAELVRAFPELRPVVIADLLRDGETANIVAAPKTGKSWLALDLALAVASGTEWLGKQTTQGRVLIVDGELHRETIARRFKTIMGARGCDPVALGSIDVRPLRGRRRTIDDLWASLRDIPTGVYRLVVVDALYRFLPVDGEENRNETMTHVYNVIDAIAKQLGCAVVVIHHTSKGDQSGRSVTDVGSGAGAQSRAVDAHVVLRLHEEDDAVIVDAAVRSFPPMAPFVIRSTKPGWLLAPDLDPTLYRTSTRRKAKSTRDTEHPPEPKRVEVWTPERFAREVIGCDWRIRADVLARARDLGIGKGQSEDLLARALAAGLVARRQDGPSSPHRFGPQSPGLLDGRPAEGGG